MSANLVYESMKDVHVCVLFAYNAQESKVAPRPRNPPLQEKFNVSPVRAVFLLPFNLNLKKFFEQKQPGKKNKTMSIQAILGSNPCDLLPEVPGWTKKTAQRRVKQSGGKFTLVSAVCPDYERQDGRFTYDSLGSAIPFIAAHHLRVASVLKEKLEGEGIHFEFHITLADTEFDLPLVVENMTDGDSDEFLRRCECSARELEKKAHEERLNIKSSERFTVAFPDWFQHYNKAVKHLEQEVAEAKQGASITSNFSYEAMSRVSLYKAMAGCEVDSDYCRKMVIRQWAQYMAWGECATQKFGDGFVMMNHDTPNLSRVNDPHFRKGRERIPVLKLNLKTTPE